MTDARTVIEEGLVIIEAMRIKVQGGEPPAPPQLLRLKESALHVDESWSHLETASTIPSQTPIHGQEANTSARAKELRVV